MTLKSEGEEFALFIDESGSAKPNPNDQAPFFAMGGIIVKRSDEALIESSLAGFKERWKIAPDTPLHGNEIRARKKRFAWLGTLPQLEYERFMQDLTDTIVSCPVTVHACVISRSGYFNRYFQTYGVNTWEMMKSAFTILVERAAKYADSKNGTVMVYYEKAGKTEDRLIEKYFRDLRCSGHFFDPTTSNKYSPMSATQMTKLLRGIEGKTKSRAELQLADLCLYPVVRSKDRPDDRAFMAMNEKRLLVDCHLHPNDVETKGIKYYCFDGG
jgi:hypothetical protein